MSNKVILQNSGDEIYNPPALVALRSTSIYGSANLVAPVSMVAPTLTMGEL